MLNHVYSNSNLTISSPTPKMTTEILNLQLQLMEAHKQNETPFPIFVIIAKNQTLEQRLLQT